MASVLASPTRNPPQVPPEVWLTIFDFATDLATLLSSDRLIFSDLPRTLARQQELWALKESLPTKRSIGLVCRTWNELSLEFMYQSILVTKVDTLISLHKTLYRNALTTQGKNRLGRWTKRLDVFIQEERCETSDYSVLAEVIREFPNLSIVTLSVPLLPFNNCWLHQIPTSVIVSLAETCGTLLQVFDCSESILRPCREDLMVLLAASPNLRLLRCPICSPTPEDRASKGCLDVPIMPKLESITLISVFLRDFLPQGKGANHLPTLRQLTYDCIPPPFFDTAWKSFVNSTCANLTCVIIDFCRSGDTLQNELDLLSKCCPALDRLIIYLHTWLGLKPHLILPPVSYLALYPKAVKVAVSDYQVLFSALVTMTAARLRTVRLLHIHVVEGLREHLSSLTAEDRARLTLCNFSFEDSEGRVLVL